MIVRLGVSAVFLFGLLGIATQSWAQAVIIPVRPPSDSVTSESSARSRNNMRIAYIENGLSRDNLLISPIPLESPGDYSMGASSRRTVSSSYPSVMGQDSYLDSGFISEQFDNHAPTNFYTPEYSNWVSDDGWNGLPASQRRASLTYFYRSHCDEWAGICKNKNLEFRCGPCPCESNCQDCCGSFRKWGGLFQRSQSVPVNIR